jgi:hypothetical protein
LAERTGLVVVETSILAEQTAYEEAEEFLHERGFPDATIVLVRSAGDTGTGHEEIWFKDKYGRKMLATLIPTERKLANGSIVQGTRVETEYGW